MNERMAYWVEDTIKLAVFMRDGRRINSDQVKEELVRIVNGRPGLIDRSGLQCGREMMEAVLAWSLAYVRGEGNPIHAGKAVRALPRPEVEFLDVPFEDTKALA